MIDVTLKKALGRWMLSFAAGGLRCSSFQSHVDMMTKADKPIDLAFQEKRKDTRHHCTTAS
jgi:hypothetical protein